MEQLTDFITRRNYINFYLSGSCKHRNQPSYLHVFARSECDVANRIPQNVANNNTFSLGERIATPVCALVRNDVRFMKLTVKLKFGYHIGYSICPLTK